MASAASSPDLQKAIRSHLEVTKGHVQRLEQIFMSLGEKPKSKPCAGMKGLIQEGQETIKGRMAEQLMDAALIGAAQRVEHYEMAAYGTARSLAEKLGNTEAVELLEETLNEEKDADSELSRIAEQLLEKMDETADETAMAAKSRNKTRTSRA